MILIKKYSNRKLYDTKNKRFITMDEIADLIIAGEELQIKDNKTGEDLTSSIASQLLGRKKNIRDKGGIPSNILFQLLRRGSGGFLEYVRRYIGLWQSVLTMADDEIDNLVNLYIKNNEISKSEAVLLKREIKKNSGKLKAWISDTIDERMSSAMEKMNLATTDQWSTIVALVEDLIDQVQEIADKMEDLEKKM